MMAVKLMLLPSRDFAKIRLFRIPDDLEGQEAFRHATGIVAEVEEKGVDYSADDICEALEDHGFECVAFLKGPALD